MNYEISEHALQETPNDSQTADIQIEFVDIYESEDDDLAVAMNCSNG